MLHEGPEAKEKETFGHLDPSKWSVREGPIIRGRWTDGTNEKCCVTIASGKHKCLLRMFPWSEAENRMHSNGQIHVSCQGLFLGAEIEMTTAK